MLRLRDLARNHRAAGALNEHVPVWGWIDQQAFLTKQGHVGIVMRIDGVDYECLSSSEIDSLTQRLEAAFRTLGPEFRVYQYLFRRNHERVDSRDCSDPIVSEALRERREHFERKASKLFSLSIYYVVLYQGGKRRKGLGAAMAGLLGGRPGQALRDLRTHFSDRECILLGRGDIEKAHRTLLGAAQTFALQIGDLLNAVILPREEAFRALYRLLNVEPTKIELARLASDTHSDYFLCGSEVAFWRDHMEIDGYYTRVLVLREPSPSSWPLIWKGLYHVGANYHVASEWRALTGEEAGKQIDRARRYWHNTRVSLAAQVSTDPARSAGALTNRGNEAIVDTLGELQRHLEIDGKRMGEYALTVVVYDRDPQVVQRACSAFLDIFASHQALLLEEGYNQANAFFATLPGNDHFQLRRLLMLDDAHADYSFAFTLDSGQRQNAHLGQEYLAALETQSASPYYFNLHQDDVGHTFILGRTGAGKSFLLNFLLTHAQKYQPLSFVFEMGGSFAGIAQLFGGSYVRVGREEAFRINPFCLPDSKENTRFLYSLLRVLIEGQDGYVLTPADERDVYECLQSLYQVDAGLRTLSVFSTLLRRQLADRLHKWVQGGAYDFIFDNPVDTLSFQRFQVFDFEAMRDHPEVLGPLLFYVLHRAGALIRDPALLSTFKLFVADEAWRFLTHPVLRAFILEALKTWRKKNAAVVLATHSLDDLRQSEILEQLLDSCPTKLFLANPDLDPDTYGSVFRLNDTEKQLVSGLAPKRQLMLKRRGVAKVLNLDIDRSDRAYWLYTNTPADNLRREAAIAEHGFEAGLDALVRS